MTVARPPQTPRVASSGNPHCQLCGGTGVVQYIVNGKTVRERCLCQPKPLMTK